jgi:hypothetical protein
MSACPRSYGTAVAMPFSEVVHNPLDRTTDPLTDVDVAEGQLKWLIVKGDLILSNSVTERTAIFNRNFLATGSKSGSFPIYAYDYDDVPDRLASSRYGKILHLI